MSKLNYRKSNEYFRFHNENPKGKLRAQDCVIRALGYANNGWNNVYKELCNIGYEIKDTFNSDDVFNEYLKRNNWIKMKQPRKSNNNKYTLKEFAQNNNKGIIIITVANHMTCIDDGIIIDTWDCGYKCVSNYWIKQ